MSYKSFTWDILNDKFGIDRQQKKMFEPIKTPPVNPSEWLLQTLKINTLNPLLSQKARSEAIIYPILTECRQQSNNNFTLYSGIDLPADKKMGLNGECDFLMSSVPNAIGLISPIFTTVEAKKMDIDLGLEQCAAQMLGARVYNQKHKNPIETIYGCVTTGTEWQFLLLENNIFWVDTNRYYLNNLPQLLGILQTIVDFYKK